MSLTLVVVVTIICCFTFSETFPTCPYGMVWNTCKYEYSETCDGPYPNIKMCFHGCDCKPGTVLLMAYSNFCVPVAECPEECGKKANMAFTLCKLKCHEVCDVETGKRETRCQEESGCVRGCTCVYGYGLNVDGTCTKFTESNCYSPVESDGLEGSA